MASKLPLDAQAVISKCELCDRDSDARWFCKDCDEEMCKQCKTTHLRSKATRNHNIISIASDKDDISVEPALKTCIFCSSHPEEPVQMYCIDCETLVCFTCIADKQHKNHSLEKTANIIDKCREELSQCITETKQEISGLQSSLLLVQNNETTYSTQSSNIIDQINKERQDRKSQIDTIVDGLIKQLKQCEGRDLQVLRDQGIKISKEISDKKDVLQVCEDTLKSTHDVSIITLTADIKRRQKQYRSIPTPSSISPSRFVRSDSVDLQDVFGHLETNKDDEKTSSTSVDMDVGTCFSCGKQGHLSRDCTEEKHESQSPDRCYNCNKVGHRTFECTSEPSRRDDRQDYRCYICNEVGHRAFECTNERPRRDNRQDDRCYNCNKVGHHAFECTSKRSRNGDQQDDDVQCYICKEYGHFARKCPEKGSGAKCYRCGKYGHFARDCSGEEDPEINDVKAVKCYHCGKQGHFARDCPDDDTSNVECYHCGRMGHHAWNCPDPDLSSSSSDHSEY